MKKRFALLWAALLLCAALLALPAAADEGDYDRINEYLVTVDLREDGSADITYDIDWQVLTGSDSEYLSWVKIGLANSYAEDLTPLTDSIAALSLLEDGGVYAKVVFSRRYYSPAVAAENGGESRVRFAFTVHQSHLFTSNDDGTASFDFTPGWFDDLCVERMVVRWKNGDGFVADNTGTDGDYLTWEFGPLAHGQAGTVHVTVPVAVGSAFDPAQALTAADVPGAVLPPQDGFAGHFSDFLIAVVVLVAIGLLLASLPAGWGGGFGEGIDPNDWYWYSNGLHTVRLLRSAPPPQGYHRVDPPRQFQAGGGGTRGGGVGRRSGGGRNNHGSCACVSGCACACASSCACACACAGGGRAGCSVKELYRVKLPQHQKEVPHEPGE